MNAKKEKALHALLTTNTLAQAAEIAGVGTRTLYRYLHEDEEFKQRYDEETGRLVCDAMDMLQKSFKPAIERMQRIIQDDHISPAIQIQACRAVMDYGIKLTEVDNIIRRLEALEEATEGSLWRF